ncbi:SDR family NAD(P)-dependent oxidoreductase [Micromonospora kangleipakensis]|uniref:SDR family NAD(P)-dependent oxidoreductase n=1 Tax=Micromonospora kangleipakensis TaxID=1077942 RepID=UPI00102975F8|nr:SDR family oxidoreductase [Micromonospora kangleipakensis]
MAAHGAAVGINGSRDQGAVDAVVEEIRAAGGTAFGVMADVSDPDAVARMVDAVHDELGPIDIAVSNVGVRKAAPLEELTVQDWRSTMASNLDAVFFLARLVLPGLRERGWGPIINISGYDRWTGHIHHRAANITAKAGMHGLTKAIAREFSANGITANTVAPRAIRTVRDEKHYAHVDVDAILQRLATADFGEPEDIAEMCVYLAGDGAKFVTGQVLYLNAGEYMF